ncbi:hypothetical protein Tco_0072824 [Tanacetum coccineum]
MSSLKEDIQSIKNMMTEMYEVFKGQSSYSVTPTLALTHIPTNVKGENTTNTAIEDHPSHTERETREPKRAIIISTIQPTQAQPITTIITHSKSSQVVPKSDKGKGIATKSDEDILKRLVPASTIVHPDPDALIPYKINGEVYHLTAKQLQEQMDKEELIKKDKEEPRLLAISKPKVIKVVQEEAKKIGLDLGKIASAKAGEKFKKAQDVEHKVLKREHTKKVRKSHELRKHKYETIRKIPEELKIKSALPAPAPEQASSQSLRKKRKHMELEPEIKIIGLKCN